MALLPPRNPNGSESLTKRITFTSYRGDTPFYMVDNDDAPDDELWEIHCHHEPGKVFAKYAHEVLATIDVDSSNAGWQFRMAHLIHVMKRRRLLSIRRRVITIVNTTIALWN